jgi:hypothetical protein
MTKSAGLNALRICLPNSGKVGELLRVRFSPTVSSDAQIELDHYARAEDIGLRKRRAGDR